MALHKLYTSLAKAHDRGTDIDTATALSTSITFPYHNNSLFKYGAGSPIFRGNFEQMGLTFNKGTSYDQPGGGHSNEPFINSPIQGGFANVGITFDSLTEGFIRGGAATHAKRLAIDTKRITKFYLSPRGLGFLAKQVGLQASNPQIRPGGFFSSPSSNQRTYNLGINTLAQIATSGTGLHIKREGLLPTSFDGYVDDIDLTKLDTQSKNYDDLEKGNRLLSLFESHIKPGTTLSEKTTDPEAQGGFLGDLSAFLGGNINPELYSFKGGAGSTYGIGQTTLYKYEDTSQGKIRRDIGGKTNNTLNVEDIELKDKEVVDFEDLVKYTHPSNVTMGPKGPKISLQSDPTIRNKDIGTKDSNDLPHYPDIIENQPTKYTKGISQYHVSYNGEIDQVNSKKIQLDQPEYKASEDFIPFRFESVNTDNPQLSDYIVFRAFLDDISDTYNASHNEFNYNGRGETFYTYNNFKRSISFSFKIAAQSKDEMQPIYQKLNYLLSNTAPDYSSVGRMRTPFMKLTIGDWCSRLPGVLNSISLKWQKDYPWDLGGKDDPKSSGLILPHVLDVSVQFTPIHQFMPEKSKDSQFFKTKINA